MGIQHDPLPEGMDSRAASKLAAQIAKRPGWRVQLLDWRPAEHGFPAGAVIECYHTGMQPRRMLYIRSAAHWERVYPHVEAACEKWSNKHE